MEPEYTDGSGVLETTENADVETANEAPGVSAEEIEELRAKAAKADELESKNKQLFERLKKKDEHKETAPSQDGLTSKDILFLAKTDIHADDLDDVLDWAKFKKVGVQEAYQMMKPTLDVKAEMRRTAGATQVRASARGASKASGADLLSKAMTTGEVPESDDGMRELFQARMLKRLGKLQ